MRFALRQYITDRRDSGLQLSKMSVAKTTQSSVNKTLHYPCTKYIYLGQRKISKISGEGAKGAGNCVYKRKILLK